MLVFSVVIRRDDAAADIGVFADFGISDITQMRAFDFRMQNAVLDLDVITDPAPRADLRLIPDMGVRPIMQSFSIKESSR